ncbi:MAG: hypothetical protein Kow00117_10990 [Phototrophicales bacterium]
MLKRIKRKIWTRKWTQEQLNKYIGNFQHVYFTYAADEALRARAASGGSTSALLVYLLETGQIDGAVVCRTVLIEGKPRPEFFIARTKDDIIAAQGSKYSAVYFAANAFPLIRAFEGKLAVVALPCDAKNLQRWREKHPEIDQKIACVITLFCGHNSEPELTDAIIKKLGHPANLVDYTYRFGHWRGNLKATYDDGTEIIKPFKYFSDYRNLYFFAQEKCHHCFDHYGYYCDISAGDIWSPEMKHDPIKHTCLITRSDVGQRIVETAVQAGALVAREESIVAVANGQARTMPFHYNITSRARVGRLLGLKIKDETKERVRWNDYLIAFIALFNERFSKTRIGRRIILMMPRPLIKLYLYLFKGLETF